MPTREELKAALALAKKKRDEAQAKVDDLQGTIDREIDAYEQRVSASPEFQRAVDYIKVNGPGRSIENSTKGILGVLRVLKKFEVPL